jgi:hypothetical protein
MSNKTNMTDEEYEAICWREAQASFPKRKHGFRAYDQSRFLTLI